jgi:5-methylcytosine-specific restriction endonuclease McrA
MRYAVCLGCGKLCAPGPRCPDCKRARDRLYDAARPAHHAVYATAEWRRLSAAVRAGATRCHWCGKRTTRLVGDHVIPVEERPELALEPSNVVPSCYGCNTRRGRNLKPARYRQPTFDELMAHRGRS